MTSAFARSTSTSFSGQTLLAMARARVASSQRSIESRPSATGTVSGVSSGSTTRDDVDETWVASTSAQVQSLDLSDLDPGTYFWRVSTLDADGYESAWSHTAHFIYPMALR